MTTTKGYLLRSMRKQPTFGDVVSPRNDVSGTRREIPYWRRITTQIWVTLLIGFSGKDYTHVWVMNRDQCGISPLDPQTLFPTSLNVVLQLTASHQILLNLLCFTLISYRLLHMISLHLISFEFILPRPPLSSHLTSIYLLHSISSYPLFLIINTNIN